jgi:RNA polymerase sigma-70 factor (ECF subfamily)
MRIQPSASLVNQLLAQARDGSTSAIEELLAAYGDYLRNLASQRLGSKLGGRVSPSDLVQETFLAAWRDFSSFRGADAPQFSVWLRTILLRKISAAVALHVNTSKRDLQREQHASTLVGSSILEITKTLPSKEETPSKIVSSGEDTLLIQRLLTSLPDEYRLVIQWRNLDGIQFNEIASRLGKTSGATRLVWLRAIRMLREMYESEVKS